MPRPVEEEEKPALLLALPSAATGDLSFRLYIEQ